jgi:hypothetical protein
MSCVWKTYCHLYLFFYDVFKMRKLLLQKNKRELSEYKAIGMIQDHVSLLYQAIQRNTQKSNKDFNPFVRPPTEEWTEISSI